MRKDHRRPRKRERDEVAAAVQRLDRAYRAVTAARRHLAAQSAPERHVEPAAALRANRDMLLRRPGVVGVGVGRSADTGDPMISVFVRDPVVRPRGVDADLPKQLSLGRRTLDVETIPFGDLVVAPARGKSAELVARSADSVAVTLGGGIGQRSPATLGTLGSLARLPSGELVGITAKHIVDGSPPVPMVARPSLGAPEVAPIGTLDRGTLSGVDAARIRFDTGVALSWFVPTVGDIQGWRRVVPGDVGQGACIVGAVSGRLDGTIRSIHTDFPEFSLNDVIVVTALPTREGDSGAALLDSDKFVLGFLVGAVKNVEPELRLFSPAEAVLSGLGCNIP